MVDRHLLGDIALAVLLALPTAAFSRPDARIQKSAAAHVATPMVHAQLAELSTPRSGVSLLG